MRGGKHFDFLRDEGEIVSITRKEGKQIKSVLRERI